MVAVVAVVVLEGGWGQVKVGMSPRRSWAMGLPCVQWLSMIADDGSSCRFTPLLMLLLLLLGVEVVLVVPIVSSGRVVLWQGATTGRRGRRVWWTRRCKAKAGVCFRCPPRGSIKALVVCSSPRARRRMERVSLPRFMVLWGGGGQGGRKDETHRERAVAMVI